MFQHRRSVPNIKVSSSFTSGIDMTSASHSSFPSAIYMTSASHSSFPSAIDMTSASHSSFPSGIDMTCAEWQLADRAEKQQNEGLQHSLFSQKFKTSAYLFGDRVDVKDDEAAGDECWEVLEADLDTRMESLCLSVTEHAEQILVRASMIRRLAYQTMVPL